MTMSEFGEHVRTQDREVNLLFFVSSRYAGKSSAVSFCLETFEKVGTYPEIFQLTLLSEIKRLRELKNKVDLFEGGLHKNLRHPLSEFNSKYLQGKIENLSVLLCEYLLCSNPAL